MRAVGQAQEKEGRPRLGQFLQDLRTQVTVSPRTGVLTALQNAAEGLEERLLSAPGRKGPGRLEDEEVIAKGEKMLTEVA